MSKENPDEMDLAALRSTLQQLIKKKDVILEYDKQIIDGINDAKQLEAEILETEDLQSNIEEKTFQVQKFLELQQLHKDSQSHNTTSESPSTHNAGDNTPETSQAPESLQQVTQTQAEHSQQVLDIPVETTSSPQHETPPTAQQVATNQVLPTVSSSIPCTTQNTSRLPKLSLPTFNGNPLALAHILGLLYCCSPSKYKFKCSSEV